MNNPPTSCDFLNFRLTYISPPGYFMKLFKKGRAAIFIPATQNLKGYPRKLVVEDLLDTTQRIESAGGEIYRYGLILSLPGFDCIMTNRWSFSPTRLLRRSEGLQMLLISDQTFFQDTEGNITELCSSTVAPDLSRSRSHISDSFSSDMSLTWNFRHRR